MSRPHKRRDTRFQIHRPGPHGRSLSILRLDDAARVTGITLTQWADDGKIGRMMNVSTTTGKATAHRSHTCRDTSKNGHHDDVERVYAFLPLARMLQRIDSLSVIVCSDGLTAKGWLDLR